MRTLVVLLLLIATPARADCRAVNSAVLGVSETTGKLIELVMARIIDWDHVKITPASRPRYARVRNVGDQLKPALAAYYVAGEIAFNVMASCFLNGGYYSAKERSALAKAALSSEQLKARLVDYPEAYEALP